jgi:hypothetical protein
MEQSMEQSMEQGNLTVPLNDASNGNGQVVTVGSWQA